MREQYYPFEEGLKAGTAQVYHHEMPGGQYTNLRQQAKSLGLEDRWNEIADMYAQVNEIFGDIVKVTPSSKVVGDMALFMVTNGLTAMDVLNPGKKLNFPKSVVEMMQGAIGFPEGGWPKVLQKIILDTAGAKPIKGRPGAKLPKADFEKTRKELESKMPGDVRDVDVMSYLLYPQVFLDYQKHLRAIRQHLGPPDARILLWAAKRRGNFRRDRAGKNADHQISHQRRCSRGWHADGLLRAQRPAARSGRHRPSREATLPRHPKADADNPNHVAAPMPGKVSSVAVAKGQAVKAGERLLSIEAMKMETAVYCPRDAIGRRCAGQAGFDHRRRRSAGRAGRVGIVIGHGSFVCRRFRH